MSASVWPSAGRIAEIAPAVDHLLGRAAADAELQPAAGDEIGRAGVLRHVERVLVAHVDDGRADLDAAGPRADGRQQRERRGELAGEMVDAEIGAVRAQLLGGDGEVDRLQQRVGRRARLRLRRGRPVPEREKADLLHAACLSVDVAVDVSSHRQAAERASFRAEQPGIGWTRCRTQKARWGGRPLSDRAAASSMSGAMMEYCR